MKKTILRILFIVMLLALASGIHYAWISFPIISGFDAKEMCSCVFVSGRDKRDIDTSEFSDFPFSLGRNEVNIGIRLLQAQCGEWQRKKQFTAKGQAAHSSMI